MPPAAALRYAVLVFGARDVGWALGLGMLLVVLVQCRAEWSAQAAVERDATQGFLEAYAGSRFLSGELVTPGNGGYADPLKPTIEAHRFEILAKRQSLSGRAVELVARQIIKLVNGVPGGEDASQEVHVKLERKGSGWEYTLFETRDGQLLQPPGDGNPWSRALLARQQAAQGPAGGGTDLPDDDGD
jgi:hypothetical protein